MQCRRAHLCGAVVHTMNRPALIFIGCLLLLLVSAPRLPAPIVESDEKPTPKPAQSEAPRSAPKHSRKSEVKSSGTESPPSHGPVRFAGSWTGKISQGLLGHTPTTLAVSSDATSVTLSHNFGGGSKPATASGGTLSWRSGLMGEITWTLTPNGDGQTARVTMKGLVVNDTATFRRGPPPAETKH
jgi:hypothetical protein